MEGAAENGVGDFRGRVLAIGVQETDPIAASSEGAPLEQEGLVGWGTTCFLVADERKPEPIWVKKEDVLSHSIDDARLGARPGSIATGSGSGGLTPPE